jgi:hypothetical protein
VKEQMLRAIAAANGDPQFALAARLWDGDVVFACGEDAVRLRVRAGRVTDAADGATDARAVRITATGDVWERMLEPQPRAFYHDLFGTAMRHGLVLDGRIEDIGPYYGALQRIIELAREGGPP